MYYIYHIYDGKVGITKNPEKRIVQEQGCREDEYEIVEVADKLKDALDAEQTWNDHFGYKKTPKWHPDLKKMKDTYKYNSGVSVTLDHDYLDQETLTFIDKDGSKYYFDDVSKIPTQLGKYPEGNPKPFAYWKAIRNAYEEIIQSGLDTGRGPCAHENIIPEFAQIRSWARDRGLYEGGDPVTQMVKLMEELGETSKAILKPEGSTLKTGETREEAILDGLGDCLVVLINLSHLCGYRLEDALASAYDEIKGRTGGMINGTFVKDEL